MAPAITLQTKRNQINKDNNKIIEQERFLLATKRIYLQNIFTVSISEL
jgi:hypothetical protein